jgi:hypothetical protein
VPIADQTIGIRKVFYDRGLSFVNGPFDGAKLARIRRQQLLDDAESRTLSGIYHDELGAPNSW